MIGKKWYNRARARLTHGDLAADFATQADVILDSIGPPFWHMIATEERAIIIDVMFAHQNRMYNERSDRHKLEDWTHETSAAILAAGYPNLLRQVTELVNEYGWGCGDCPKAIARELWDQAQAPETSDVRPC